MHSPVSRQESRGREVAEVETLIQGYSNYLSALQKSAETVEEYAKDVRAWAAWWGKDVRLFDTDAWDEWLFYSTERGITGFTIRRYQTSVRRFYKYLRRKRIVTHDPSMDSESVGVVKRLPIWLTEEEVGKLYAACQTPRELAILELLYACGLRNSEVRAAKPSDLTQTTLLVHGKGGKERVISITSASFEAINAYVGGRKGTFYAIPGKRGNQTHEKTICAFIGRLVASSGILKDVTPHTLRHSIATHLLARGCDLAYIQTFLGHEDIGTTRIYTHIVNSVATKAILQAHPRTTNPSPIPPSP